MEVLSGACAPAPLNPETASYSELEEALVMADAGAETAANLVRAAQARTEEASPAQRLTAEMTERLAALESPLATDAKPFVIMLMGANGAGKTTTTAKMCRHFAGAGKTCLLAAADTFRAAAREQLESWAGKLGADFVSAGDPGAAAFDAAKAGAARGRDVVLIDTSGRLPAQQHLMAELGKISRAVAKALPGAPHESLLVLDANAGRDALRQAEGFSEAAGVSGYVIAKLDGSARGGFLLELAEKFPRPVRFVGTGESAASLSPFFPAEYARSLLNLE